MKKIRIICIIANPKGIEALGEKYPDVDIYCGAVDDGLNDQHYIVPGLGDAGSRMFGTK